MTRSTRPPGESISTTRHKGPRFASSITAFSNAVVSISSSISPGMEISATCDCRPWLSR
ncbi:MAG: hypothetical protein GX455_06395 [Phycisphaerae bacterium]|nr:hypothetical protein [Phycisphaerae bacterium]